MKVPFLSFEHMHGLFRNEAIEAFTKFYDDGNYILGKGVEEFEKEYAAFSHTRHCVGVSNGLDALFIALKVLGIGAGDEVIVPSNTFIATVSAVSYTGATPVFAEPNIETYNITTKSIEPVITSSTKAIIPVHLYGQSCEMDDIMQLAATNNLFVVEDNAQAHGASFNNKTTGGFGHINATSFYPAKNLGALGDAGAITTNNEDFALSARMLGNYGSREKYYNEIIGFNKRLDELQARFLSLKLKYLSGFTIGRRMAAKWYNDLLMNTGDIILPHTRRDATHVYHLYVIRTQHRDALQTYLRNKGVGTLIHYPIPPHLQKAYRYLGYNEHDLPVAESLAKTSLSLPLYTGITNDQVSYVCNCMKDFFKAAKIKQP
jgi:dTDP-4-amino-4,6-dideoxygalactose transaminase